MSKIFTANVIEICENGDAILELPKELLEEVGWKEGDTINIDDRDGSIILSKVNNGETTS
jgi:bifunctional DNA-binding transcriptional regulator/antitoxin component of YhaV-PrlF toxin-antitoxin module